MHTLSSADWLSGLTCTDENFITKAGSQAFAKAEAEGIALIVPDTSPRGEGVPDDANYDLGQGAGFYIDATQAPWSENFNMESYVGEELPALVEAEWGVGSNGMRSLAGHSMGGHGALTLGLKAPPGAWASVSALAPICNPTKCPWGEKAFTNYFGSVEAGKDHDATFLIQKKGKAGMFDDILIDEGTEDNFGKEGQLLLSNFEEAAAKVGQKLTVRRQPGHGHSYYFIASFIADHIAFHARRLQAAASKAADAAFGEEAAAMVSAGTAGKPIKCKAMVARAAKQPLVCEEITVGVPKAGEVRVKVVANALCKYLILLQPRTSVQLLFRSW